MAILYGTNGAVRNGGAVISHQTWSSDASHMTIRDMPLLPRRGALRFHVHQTRRQLIQTLRHFSLPTSLHRREKRRARKRRRR